MTSKAPSSSNSPQNEQSHLTDYIRQIIILVAAPSMWILSSLSQFDDNARSPDGLSDINESLLVPLGFAFAIWFPIFVGCIAYGIIQVLPPNRTRKIFRHSGKWSAAGFIGICIWSLISAYAGESWAQWGTAIIFIPAMLCLVNTMLILTRGRHKLDNLETVCVWLPVSLIAGWTSLAVFLNWTPIVIGLFGSNVPFIVPNIIMLLAALVWAGFMTRKSGANRAYAFPIIWGLSFLFIKQVFVTQDSILIGGLALAGALLIIGLAAFKPEIDASDYRV
ncbi:hypothetical protein [Litorimonas sp.]|uniref:hypothetical protein n=1 Tax=Litorimonas sp. TaxID=1892381 RepID=UPI003A8C078A